MGIGIGGATAVAGGAATVAAADAVEATVAAFAVPGASEDRAAFIFFPTLDPFRNDTEVRFSPKRSKSTLFFLANAVASFARS